MSVRETNGADAAAEISTAALVTVEQEAVIEAIAERTAAKLAQGLLRLPDDVRAALGEVQPAGYFMNPSWFGYGASRYEFRMYARPTGIQLAIVNPVGETVWSAVLL